MVFKREWRFGLLLAFSAMADASGGSLQINAPWIRDAPPDARMRAGYAVLVNNSDAEIEVISASSPDFDLVELHESRVEKDIARMVPLPSVKIGPRKSFEFKPGGAHFMLMLPKGELNKGDSSKIVLTLKSGAVVEAMFVVGAPSKPKP